MNCGETVCEGEKRVEPAQDCGAIAEFGVSDVGSSDDSIRESIKQQ
jgi:hypothetical protein